MAENPQPNSNEEISEQLARRDRFLRKLNSRLTPEQRMQKMATMQEQAWQAMRQNPEGYARFLRRNFKARAIDVRDFHAR
jgi:hypothetical protein